MKCPKCHYLSFEPEARCRNCGYSFSPDEQDLVIRDLETPPAPLADLDLRPGVRDESRAPSAARSSQPIIPVADPAPTEPAPTPIASASAMPSPPAASPAPTTELPLFVKALSQAEPEATPENDAPLVKVAAEPRPPLAVRRKTADGTPRSRTAAPISERRRVGPFDRDLLEDLQRIEQQDRGAARPADHPADATARVGAAKRAVAAAIDATLLGGVSTALFWITLRWCDLSFATATVLPAAPMATFLALVGVGYLLMFTAVGGQTLGKMAVGIRVVSASTNGETNVSLRQAMYRALLTLPSVLALGLGFLPALLGDERALHDRLADTRVVRA